MLWLISALITMVIFFTFVRFTIVKEGTAKAIVRFGQFRKAVMAWEGYHLNDKWEVESGDELHLLPGGLRLVGIWPIDQVYRYNFRWRDVQLAKGEEKIEFHEEVKDYVFVRQDVYWTELKKAETKAPEERIPVNVQFLVTMRVTNPHKVLFRAPSNWNENAMFRLNALFRDWVGRNTLDYILSARKNSTELLIELGTDPLIADTLKNEWGVTIDSIQIKDVSMEKEYEEAAAKEKQMVLVAKGRSAETIGTVLEMMARARGKTPEDIQGEINSDQQLQQEFLKLSHDLIIRKMGMEAGAYTDIRVMGAEGLERAMLNALAVWKRIPTGRAITSESKKKEEKKGSAILEEVLDKVEKEKKDEEKK